MPDALSLARSFAAAAPATATFTVDEGLAWMIQELIDRARAGWPELELSEERFVEHAARSIEGNDVATLLAALHAADLWLACGCASGDPAAIAAFDREVLSQTRMLLGRMQPTAQLVDEVRQLLREKLLVAQPGQRPRIAEYAGRGPLQAWVRVTAVRTALDLLRAGGVRTGGEVQPDDLAAAASSPELEYLKERYRPQFKVAFQEALRALDPDKRNVLRLHVVEGLNIDEIGALFKVHRATVARWIAAARQEILAGARETLRRELGLSGGEFDSLAVVVRSQLDLSVAKILRKPDT
ncbi:MAG: putative DNA-binding regulatory protein [Myxococcales bacterium]|nr:putative DNA-binding regulatory protein [Myxococcales bacterium]